MTTAFQIFCAEKSALRAAETDADLLAMSASDEHRVSWAQHFSPPSLGEYMASLMNPKVVDHGQPISILDPGAGTGILGLSLVDRIIRANPNSRIILSAIEPEPRAHRHLEQALLLAKQQYGARISTQASSRDFLSLRTFAPQDLIICNPPFRKSLSPNNSAPNLYALFMEAAAEILRPGGQMCFIVPRSFMSGSRFRAFRHRLHSSLHLDLAHTFASRKVFPGVLQEMVVVVYSKRTGTTTTIRKTKDLSDLMTPASLEVSTSKLLAHADGAFVPLPTNAYEYSILDKFSALPERFENMGMAVSTGPVVPFRHNHLLVMNPTTVPTAPLLWLQHVTPNAVSWPLRSNFDKQQHVRLDRKQSNTLLIPSSNYVLVRRFSPKESIRVVAAPLLRSQFAFEMLGIENHLNYIRSTNDPLNNSLFTGISAFINSKIYNEYFQIISGTTQVSAAELRSIPSIGYRSLIHLGKQVGKNTPLDRLVAELVKSNSPQ